MNIHKEKLLYTSIFLEVTSNFNAGIMIIVIKGDCNKPNRFLVNRKPLGKLFKK
jgi:hypothetical protein